MTSSARAAGSPSKRPKKTGVTGKAPAKTARATSGGGKRAATAGAKSARKRTTKSPTSVAIATELAPAVAIALLEKTEQAPGAAPAALECLAAGAVPSEDNDKVRVQLMFENGTVLPVEMSTAAGAALAKGLVNELPKA